MMMAGPKGRRGAPATSVMVVQQLREQRVKMGIPDDVLADRRNRVAQYSIEYSTVLHKFRDVRGRNCRKNVQNTTYTTKFSYCTRTVSVSLRTALTASSQHWHPTTTNAPPPCCSTIYSFRIELRHYCIPRYSPPLHLE